MSQQHDAPPPYAAAAPGPTYAPYAPAAVPLSVRRQRLWPDDGGPLRRRAVGAAVGAGALAAWIVLDAAPGLGLLVVGLFMAATAAMSLPRLAPPRRGHHHVAVFGGLALVLLGTLVLRDAGWVVTLALLASACAASVALVGGRTWTALALAPWSVPLGGLLGLPWIARALTPPAQRTGAWLPLLRGTAVTAVLVIVFAALFASADAAFSAGLDALVPDVSLGELPLRFAFGAAVAGLALAAAYVAAARPRWDVAAPGPGRAVCRAEWFVPVVALDLLFALFLATQAAALAGGLEFLRRTTGLTYAEYAREGFAQLLVATLLTLGVVAVAARHAPRQTAGERAAVRVLLGLLCAMALVMVGSALHRLALYEEAFGFTRARLFAMTLEIWLGLVLVMVGVAVVVVRTHLGRGWLPRAVAASAAATMVMLVVVDPDATVATANVERFERTGRIDLGYLQGLSADAVPAFARLPEPERSCVLAGAAPAPDGIAGWNFARIRARAVLTAHDPVAELSCARHQPSNGRRSHVRWR